MSARRNKIKKLFNDKAIRELFKIVVRFKWLYAGVILFQIAGVAIDLLFADNNRRLFDAAPVIPKNLLINVLVIFIVLTVLQMLFSLLSSWIKSLLNETVVYDMRRRVLNQLQHLPLSFHDENHSSNSVNIMYRDLEFAKNFIVFDIQRLIVLPVSFVFAGIYLLTVHPILAAIAICIGPLQMLSNLVLKEKFKKNIEVQNKVTRDVFFIMGETLNGIREIKSNQMEQHIDEKMKKLQEDGVIYNVKLTNVKSVRSIVREAPGKIGYLLGVAIGASMMASGQIGPGGLVAFITLMGKVAEPFTTVVDIVSNIQQSITGARKLYEVMNMQLENMDTGIRLAPPIKSIRFNNVSFEYDSGREVLKDVNIKIGGGTSIALVGPSGGGKSTLVKLLFRFYDPIKGMLEINNIPINEYSLDTLRGNIAYVSQDIFMFDGTILDNISAGRSDASMADIQRAAVMAQAHEFIMALPEGYQTNVGERGIKLSQGQKQRLSIARAVLRNASILILDEPTSALDVETEASFQKELGEWAADCTKIIIAHRLSTIRHADYVIFIDSGRVVEEGTPAQLLREGGRFRDYWDRQNIAGMQSGERAIS